MFYIGLRFSVNRDSSNRLETARIAKYTKTTKFNLILIVKRAGLLNILD